MDPRLKGRTALVTGATAGIGPAVACRLAAEGAICGRAQSRLDAPEAEIEAGFFRKARPTSLIQRMIEPEDVANLVASVASPLSAATHGAARVASYPPCPERSSPHDRSPPFHPHRHRLPDGAAAG